MSLKIKKLFKLLKIQSSIILIPYILSGCNKNDSKAVDQPFKNEKQSDNQLDPNFDNILNGLGRFEGAIQLFKDPAIQNSFSKDSLALTMKSQLQSPFCLVDELRTSTLTKLSVSGLECGLEGQILRTIDNKKSSLKIESHMVYKNPSWLSENIIKTMDLEGKGKLKTIINNEVITTEANIGIKAVASTNQWGNVLLDFSVVQNQQMIKNKIKTFNGERILRLVNKELNLDIILRAIYSVKMTIPENSELADSSASDKNMDESKYFLNNQPIDRSEFLRLYKKLGILIEIPGLLY